MCAMTESHAEENDRLLAPYIAERNELAHRTLEAMLQNRHTLAGQLLADYQLACLAVDSAATICQWFDDAQGSWPDQIRVDQDENGPVGNRPTDE